MFRNHLKVVRCPMLDEPGIIVVGTPNLHFIQAATSAQLLAHDLVEHVNGPKRIGGIIDELEAMGAFWLARGCHDGSYQGETSIALEWIQLWDYVVDGDTQLPKHYRESRDDTYNEELLTIGEIFIVNRPEAAEHPFVKHARAAFKRGAAKAQRRYGLGFKTADHFYHVRETCNKLFKQELELGDRFTIRWDSRQATITPHPDNFNPDY